MYETFINLGLIPDTGIYGRDHFQGAGCGTLFLPGSDLLRFRVSGLRRFYFRPNYLLKVFKKIRNLRELSNFTRYAFHLTRLLSHRSGAVHTAGTV